MPLTQTADELIPGLRWHQRRLLTAGFTGGLLSLLGLWLTPTQFFQSYLTGYMFVLGLTLGCLALGMVHQLSGGAWGVVIRRPIGAASRVLPVLTVLFLPIVVGMHHLYEWTNADLVAHDEILQHKHAYLNTPFFLVRAATYFLVWNGLSYFLNAWSLEQDRTGDPRLARRMQLTSAGGLVAYGLTITFASFDWLMSLEPHWFSTIYGVLIIGGQGLSAMAFLIVALVWLSRRPPLDDIVVPSHLHDLGNLLLAFVMLWAYFSFSQYLIIWSGNLPEENVWYLHRSVGGYELVVLVLMGLHFAVPFGLLLSRDIKQRKQRLMWLVAWLLAMRLVDCYWLAMPAIFPGKLTVPWQLPAAVAAIGGFWVAIFSWRLASLADRPICDPALTEGAHEHAAHA